MECFDRHDKHKPKTILSINKEEDLKWMLLNEEINEIYEDANINYLKI